MKEKDGEPLTGKQAEVFRLIYEGARDRGERPTVYDLMATFGFASPNAVMGHIRALRAKGYLGAGRVNRSLGSLLRRPDGSPFDGFADKPREGGQAG
jgi:SOS-response transcriptional repressor LexA